MAQNLLIEHHLKRLRLPAMVRQYQKLAQESTQQNRSYQDYLLSLLELEVVQREENQQKRRIAQARFPYLRTLDQFDFSAIPSVSHTRVLELAKGEYLSRRENIILVGNMGTARLIAPLPWGCWLVGKGSGSASTPLLDWSTSSWKLRRSGPWGNAWPSSRSWTCWCWTKWALCPLPQREAGCCSRSSRTAT